MKVCSPPPDVAMSSKTGTRHLEGYSVQYTCNAGYIMDGSGSDTVTCLASGEWHDTFPGCTSKYKLLFSTLHNETELHIFPHGNKILE